jgi:hypothetical protein
MKLIKNNMNCDRRNINPRNKFINPSSLFIPSSKIIPPYAYLFWECISHTFSFVSLPHTETVRLLWRGNQEKELKIFCQVGPIHNPYFSHATRRKRGLCRSNARVHLRMRTMPLLHQRHSPVVQVLGLMLSWNNLGQFLAPSLSSSEVFSWRDGTLTSLTQCLENKPYIPRQ